MSTNGTHPAPVGPLVTEGEMDALSPARKRWGLDAAPTAARHREAVTAKAVKLKTILETIGTPLDVARGLMAKTPPPEWERDLREISPVSPAHSHLVLAWKEPPGAPDNGRWCIYEATPAPLVGTERLMELQKPPYWTLATKEERYAHAQIVSAYQWEMYRRFRVDVRPFWCLQGSEGGTPFHLSNIEKRYLRMMGLPDDPLPMAALPFTAWDTRVKARLLERDRLYRLGGAIDRLKGESVVERDEAEKTFRRRFFDWFSETMRPQSELMEWISRHEDADRTYERQTREDAMAAADARDVFIETGRLPDPRDYKQRT